MSSRVHEAVKAIALCHNVTPVYESNGVTDQAEAEKQYEDSCRVYQASSPDEVNPRPAWGGVEMPCPSPTCPRRGSQGIPPSGQTGAGQMQGSRAGTFAGVGLSS